MLDLDTFTQENSKRIHAVESSFRSSGKPLSQPGRVLIGEGILMKQSRRGPQPKAFFLFNDVLVYGSIILKGRWLKNQQIIPLEDIQLEDLEDSVRMRNQWLIRAPRKSFYVAAASYEEKRAWFDRIEDCQNKMLQSKGGGRSSTFAVTWIPNQVSAVCMRCSNKFTVTQRRHHCRKCGFVVCGGCSKKRAVIEHIHPTKPLRVCTTCHSGLQRTELESHGMTRLRRDSTGRMDLDGDQVEDCYQEGEAEDRMEDHNPNRWMDARMDSWYPYMYLR
ncbi:pleckstrin homology domain-containing family F member 1 [Mugil cephalus]|uniref:pleckstrin homology domain-containing family F member 1 n=1 Tax=Mugil cephalus TaxID=48193 RepID=UPI001FB84833|nr:pleckstrin homology domain-containing family F member 1 [Mugil cephalus]